MPVSAIEDFAHNLHAAGVDGSQIAVFGTAPALDTDGIAIRFARALARDARVVLVALGAGDAAVQTSPPTPTRPALPRSPPVKPRLAASSPATSPRT